MTAPVGMLNIPTKCEWRVLELHAFCTQCKPKLPGRISWSKRDSYLSLFLVMSEGSTPSMRFLKHCAMSSCFSKGCIAITFRCNSWKYWKKTTISYYCQTGQQRSFQAIFVHYHNTRADGFYIHLIFLFDYRSILYEEVTYTSFLAMKGFKTKTDTSACTALQCKLANEISRSMY